MAIYHLHAGFVSRSTGRSSVQSAAYICGEKLYEERRAKIADFSKKAEEVAVTNTLFPENSKYRDISVWNAIENFEDRYAEEHFKTEETQENYKSSAQTASTIVVALPNELSVKTNKKLLEEFINTRFTSRGLITTYAIHQKDGNLHAHLITTRRAIDENGEFQKRKDREICTKSAILENRKLWADLANDCIKQALCYEALKESNKELKTPWTEEQLQNKASALSQHIKEENISVLNDKNLIQEALFKIDANSQNSQETQNVDLKQMYVDRDLEKQLQTELSRSIDTGLER